MVLKKLLKVFTSCFRRQEELTEHARINEAAIKVQSAYRVHLAKRALKAAPVITQTSLVHYPDYPEPAAGSFGNFFPRQEESFSGHYPEPAAGSSGNFFPGQVGSFSFGGAKNRNFPSAGVSHLQKICLATQSINTQEVPSSYSSEVAAARTAAINFEIKQCNHEIEHILKEVLFKVTTDLFDEIETRALGEDNHPAEVSTNKTPPRALIPIKSKQHRVEAASEKSSSEAAGNVVGLASYSPFSNEEGDKIWSFNVTKPESSASTVSSIFEKHMEENYCKIKNGHTSSRAKEAEVTAARIAAIKFEIKQCNHEINHILNEVLLKVTADLSDEMETRALGEDDLPVDANQDIHDPAQKLPSLVIVSTAKMPAKAMIPIKLKENRVEAASERGPKREFNRFSSTNVDQLLHHKQNEDQIRRSKILKANPYLDHRAAEFNKRDEGGGDDAQEISPRAEKACKNDGRRESTEAIHDNFGAQCNTKVQLGQPFCSTKKGFVVPQCYYWYHSKSKADGGGGGSCFRRQVFAEPIDASRSCLW